MPDITKLIKAIGQIVGVSEPDDGSQEALDNYYAIKCIDDNDPTQTERLEIGYNLKPLIKIKLGEKPIEEPGKSYFSPENISFTGSTYNLTEQNYEAIEQLVKKYESNQRYLPLKSVIACAVGLFAFFVADNTENLTQYGPNLNQATIETQTEYPLSGHSNVDEFIVDTPTKRNDEAEELIKLGNSVEDTLVE